jgi:transposase
LPPYAPELNPIENVWEYPRIAVMESAEDGEAHLLQFAVLFEIVVA